jgi:hypothetical protein
LLLLRLLISVGGLLILLSIHLRLRLSTSRHDLNISSSRLRIARAPGAASAAGTTANGDDGDNDADEDQDGNDDNGNDPLSESLTCLAVVAEGRRSVRERASLGSVSAGVAIPVGSAHNPVLVTSRQEKRSGENVRAPGTEAASGGATVGARSTVGEVCAAGRSAGSRWRLDGVGAISETRLADAGTDAPATGGAASVVEICAGGAGFICAAD